MNPQNNRMRLIPVLLICIFIFSCNSNKFNKPAPELKKAKIEIFGNTQGTTYSIIINDEINVSKKEIDSILHDFDMELSTYEDSSFISKFNMLNTGRIEYVSDKRYFEKCLAMSDKVFQLSNGSFDPSILPLIDAWSFFKKNHDNIPDSSTVDSLRSYLNLDNGYHFTYDRENFDGLTKKTPGYRLDFNAIAQGYAVDVLYDFLLSKGGKSFYVEIGGEVRVAGTKNNDQPWVVAIEEPNQSAERKEMTYIQLDEKSLATSGNYRKFYEKNGLKYAHTINTKTGYPVTHSLLSATVVAENCAYADAYATLFMVLGVDRSMDFIKNHSELNLAVYFIFDNLDGRMEVAYNKTFEKLIIK